jgi:hypothetical protein
MITRYWFLFICIFSLLLVNGCGKGCGKEEDRSSKFEDLERRLSGQKGGQTQDVDRFKEFPAGKGTQGPPEGTPADFFPIAVGSRWEYKIEPGTTEPLMFQETIWPRGKSVVVSQTRGRLFLSREQEGRKNFTLAFSVLSEAKKQSPLGLLRGVQLKLEKDDLGIFKYAEKVLWVVSLSQGFMARQVVIFSSDSPGAPGGPWGTWGGASGEGGYTLRAIFFGDKPGVEVGMGREPKDTLEFKGVESGVPGSSGIQCLHFIRRVKPAKREPGKKSDYLDKGFSEDIWYAKQRGLVRLVQKVDGEISMTWTLQK